MRFDAINVMSSQYSMMLVYMSLFPSSCIQDLTLASKLSMNIAYSKGARIDPCNTPFVVWNNGPWFVSTVTQE